MLILGDNLEIIKTLKDNNYQLIYFNPPFNFFENKWDKQHLNYKELWPHIWRVLKPNGAVIIHSSQRFTGYLINTQPKYFRYFYVWVKNRKTGFLHSKIQPLRQTEEVCVFYKKKPLYNPQMIKRDEEIKGNGNTSNNLYSRVKNKGNKIYTHC